MTKKGILELKELKKALMEGKEELNEQFENSAEEYAVLQTIKDFGFCEDEEELEEINVGIISALVKGSIISATLEAITKEIKGVEELLKEVEK